MGLRRLPPVDASVGDGGSFTGRGGEVGYGGGEREALKRVPQVERKWVENIAPVTGEKAWNQSHTLQFLKLKYRDLLLKFRRDRKSECFLKKLMWEKDRQRGIYRVVVNYQDLSRIVHSAVMRLIEGFSTRFQSILELSCSSLWGL